LGDSAVKFIGRQPTKLESFREKLLLIRSLLAGETVPYNGRNVRLATAPNQPVPILIAAEGPRTFELAGALCDGAIISPGSSPRFLRWAAKNIRDAATRAGRDADQVALYAQAHCVVAESSDEALGQILTPLNRSLFRYAMRVPHEEIGLARPIVPEHIRMLAAELTTHQEREREAVNELRAAMGDELLHEFVIAGTPDHCRQKVAELADVPGVRQIIINFHADDRRLSLATFRDAIIPAYPKSTGVR
jgi:alkanesulfonate monooxygenase SsuD/methylene tetrahydromethanopterin reductase-like flavin-dependent oxidoreductase (luciferase family)